MNKVAYLTVLIALNATAALAFNAPEGLQCEVKTVNGNFFNIGGGGGPQKGETIDIDLKANEITDLTFSKGGKIPMKQAGAKMVKKVTGQEPYEAFYEGTHKSTTSDYIGIFSASHGEKISYVTVQLLRKEFFAPMKLHQLTMECTQTP